MTTMNCNSLERFLADVSTVADLEGNNGKKVLRVLTRYFPNCNGQASLKLQMPLGASRLAFAATVAVIQAGVELANTEMVYGNMNAIFSTGIPNLPELSIDIRISSERSPQTMRERQTFLSDMGHGLRRVLAMVQMQPRTEKMVLDNLYLDAAEMEMPMTPEMRAAALAQFNALVNGDFSALGDTPIEFVYLAGLLLPAVADEEKKMLDEAQFSLDAAWAAVEKFDAEQSKLKAKALCFC